MNGHHRAFNSDSLFSFIVALFLGVFFVCTLYPLIYLASSSVSDPTAVAQGRVKLLPIGFSLKGYAAVFRGRDIMRGYYNSFVYMTVGTALNLVITLLTAFVLSRKELIGRSFFSFAFAFTMWFSGGLIPSYLLLNTLKLLDTRWALWLPGVISMWNVIITRTYISSTIPEALYEAASIDGCSYFKFFTRIVLPLSGAIIAVMVLFYGISHWNTYFNALIYLHSRSLYPLQIVLREILVSNIIDPELIMDTVMNEADYNLVESMKYALIIVACLPLWIMYPFIQKYFVKGVMIGSIKG